MYVLMTVAIAGAIGIDEFSEAGTVSFMFAVSLALEAWSVGRARQAVEALMKLSPETGSNHAARWLGGQKIRAGSEGGEILVVRPGEKFSVHTLFTFSRTKSSRIRGRFLRTE